MFKIGDRVKLVLTLTNPNRIYGRINEGSVGTVCRIATTGRIGISFNNYNGGHDCNGSCPNGTGLYLLPEDLQEIEKTEDDYFKELLEVLD